jgi:hypothetical protein
VWRLRLSGPVPSFSPHDTSCTGSFRSVSDLATRPPATATITSFYFSSSSLAIPCPAAAPNGTTARGSYQSRSIDRDRDRERESMAGRSFLIRSPKEEESNAAVRGRMRQLFPSSTLVSPLAPSAIPVHYRYEFWEISEFGIDKFVVLAQGGLANEGRANLEAPAWGRVVGL